MNSGEIVAASLEALAEKAGDPARQVYARLFAEHPDMEALFVRDTTGAVRGEMLAMAFECLLDIGGTGAYAANLIAAERVNHQGVGVPPEAFGRFFPILAQTCRELLGEGWTREVDEAWADVLARIAVLTPI
jgi:hemoglobin-like flavoprotein